MKETILNHPLVLHKISILRNKDTSTKEFRELISEISMMLTIEALKDIELKEIKVETPITSTKGYQALIDDYLFVPILRAGLGMVDGVLKIIPNATIGHIGLYRNEETLEPVEYYAKFPSDIENKTVILLDPMLATGGSAVSAITLLKKRGVKRIKFLGIIAASEGIERIKKEHPDVSIYVSHLDSGLNENGYIIPGLGDAGDRIFNTK